VPSCPTCGDECESETGVKIHHAMKHNESIAGVEIECDWCAEIFYRKPSYVERYDNLFCGEECKNNFHSDYLTGRERPEHSELMSELHSGEGNPMHGIRGEDAPGWEGGNHRENQTWRYTAKWSDVRSDVVERDSDECQECGTNEELHVHHITPVSNGGDKFDLENLVTLCREHHYKRHEK